MKLLLSLLMIGPYAAGQPIVAAKAGLLSYSEGGVLLNGNPVVSTQTRKPQLQSNDVLRTTGGRAEILLNPCAAMHLDLDTSFRLVSGKLTDTQIELLSGRALLRSDGGDKRTTITVRVGDSMIAGDGKGFTVSRQCRHPLPSSRVRQSCSRVPSQFR